MKFFDKTGAVEITPVFHACRIMFSLDFIVNMFISPFTKRLEDRH